MQVNSTTSLNTEYVTALQNKQSETPTTSFQDELTSQSEETSEINTSSVSAIEEPQERFYNVYTYENTKGMSSDDVDEYFAEKTEEERQKIKSVIFQANSFSKNDFANEAVFNELKNYSSGQSGNKLITNNSFFMEKSNFDIGLPTVGTSEITINKEWFDALEAGIKDPASQGIYMNDLHKARYESRNTTFENVTFSYEKAEDFLSTMTQLAKDKMEQAEGTQVYDDYKEAYERYNRMNEDNNELVAKQEENTKFEINV